MYEGALQHFLKKKKLALILIILLSAYLRLCNLDLVEFKLDEAHVSSKAVDFIVTRNPPLVGIGSSVGIANPPLFIYLMAIPLSIFRDPIFATGFIALLNVGVTFGCYLLAKEYFGDEVGLISSLLFAVSPWAVFYSRKIWSQNLLPPFTVLFFASLFLTVVKKRSWQLVLSFVWLACLIQLHLSAISFIPLMVLVLFTFESSAKPVPLICGIAAFLAIFSPYIYYEVTHDFVNFKTFIEVSRKPADFSLDSIRYAVLIISGQGYHALAGASFEKFLSEILLLPWLNAAENLLFLGGVAYLFWQVLRGRRDEVVGYYTLLSWLGVPVLFYLRHTTPVYPHYFILLYPVQFIIIAIFVVKAIGFFSRLHPLASSLFQLFIFSLIVGIALWQTYLTLSFLRFADTNETPGGYGLPVKYYIEAVRAMKRLVRGEVIVLCEGDEPSWSEIPAVFDFLSDLSLRYVDYRRSLVFPKGDALYLLAPGETHALSFLNKHARELVKERILLRGSSSFRFYRFEAKSSFKNSLLKGGFPIAFDNGVEVLSYDFRGEVKPGGKLLLFIYWWVKEGIGRRYHFFNHLVDEEGRIWAQKDGPGYPTERSKEGDVIISWFEIEVPSDAPPGMYWILMGMYAYPEGVRASVLDGEGRVVGDFLRLGPISL